MKERKKVMYPGDKFGRLSFIEFVAPPEGTPKDYGRYGKFSCQCGKLVEKRCGDVKFKHIKSCGCAYMAGKLEEYGGKFGRLTFVREVPRPSNIPKNYGKYAEFVCSCGNPVMRQFGSVVSGHTRSCGCLHRDSAKIVGMAHRLAPGEAAKNSLHHTYKRGAASRSISFELTKHEFFTLMQMSCFYCGCLPSTSHKPRSSHGAYIYNGLDRVDNSKGYSNENVVTCCKTCNFMKRAMTQRDFIDKVGHISNHLKLQCSQ